MKLCQLTIYLSAGAALPLFLCSPVQAANWPAKKTGDWNHPATWAGNSLPGRADIPVVNNGRTLKLSGGSHTVKEMRVGNAAGDSGRDGFFEMTGGDLTVTGSFSTGRYGEKQGKTTLAGGTLTAGDFWIGADTKPKSSTGEVLIRGGMIDWGRALNVGFSGAGLLTVDGEGAGSISGLNASFKSQATLRFDVGPSSVTALTVSGMLEIDAAAALVIDGSNYTGGAAVIDLVKFRTRTGAFNAGRITIQNFKGLTGSIEYDGDSMYLVLISEPIILGFSSRGRDGSVI